jgi:hypothetical protein
VTKASALGEWCAARGINSADVFAFGDMPNDLPMLAWSGRSFGVANAHPDVLDTVDEVCASNDDDGVAQVLEAVLAAHSSHSLTVRIPGAHNASTFVGFVTQQQGASKHVSRAGRTRRHDFEWHGNDRDSGSPVA